jgi:hypothetical protein
MTIENIRRLLFRAPIKPGWYGMSTDKMRVTKLTWGLVSVIFGCLLVPTLGVFFDAPWLAYFWYTALAGIFSLVMLTGVLTIYWLWNRLISSTVNFKTHQHSGLH